IIMLTAKTEEVDRIVGLELGADDYVPKPFSTRELAARVRAVLRRTESLKDEEQRANIKLGGIEMDVARRMVKVEDRPVHLPLKQFELLRVLMMNPGKVLSREELFRKVWDEESTYDTGSLDVHVRWLRERVEADPSNPRYIRTVRGIGYKIVSGED
ncbi:MAG: response regulator transcription factor, partial [Chloroflexi bacterium]|nr:response regulator transcription factor [Chloroflexota bacterium]